LKNTQKNKVKMALILIGALLISCCPYPVNNELTMVGIPLPIYFIEIGTYFILIGLLTPIFYCVNVVIWFIVIRWVLRYWAAK